MLNKELLMLGSESLEPVLSIYISPDISHIPAVSGNLSSGDSFYIRHTGEATFKFSEMDLSAIISIIHYEGDQLSTTNLMPAYTAYSGGAERAPAVLFENFLIRDRTQSASISIT
jgi:hypothetical protein